MDVPPRDEPQEGGFEMNAGIIGGGIGGLTTALYLTRLGAKVTIYERAVTLGGRLCFVRKPGGWRIDQGPTIVLLPDMIRSFLTEAGMPEEGLDFIPCDPLYELRYPDGTSLRKHRNAAAMAEEIERIFPGERAGFERYYKEMKVRFDEGRPAFLERNFLRLAEFATPANLGTLWKLRALSSARDDVKRFFIDSRLQDAFSLQTLYVGGNPFATPAIYSLIAYSEHEHGIWYLRGGYARLVELVERELKRRGVEIRLQAEVEEVLVGSNGRCRGLKLAGSEEPGIHDFVVYNGDFPGLNSLLRQPAVRKPHSRSLRERRFQPSSGCFLLYVGVNRRYDDQPIHQFLMSPDFDRHMKDVFIRRDVPDNPSVYVFHPSKTDPSLAPEGKSVLYALVPVPSGAHIDWDRHRDTLKAHILRRMEEGGWEGLRESLEWTEIRTPADGLREGLYEGGSFGIAPTLGQSAIFRPQVKPFRGIEGLYAVGASVHPGGGVPIVMQGARNLAVHLQRTGVLNSEHIF